ncbi:glycosyltransferase family 39 protein [Fontivita pretiosa]|uniref:glycosyltransferase family 39 protein n=1 Tax=Fontivita pretiosa TaxID=2989684 RepID=UPI003D177ECA
MHVDAPRIPADLPAAQSRRQQIITPVLLGLILAAAAGLRLYGLTRYSLWADEFASIQFSNGRAVSHFDFPSDRILRPGPDVTSARSARPVSAIWQALRTDTHPPLYPLVLRLWRLAFGDGDAPARSLSLVCSLLAIALLYDTARLLHGTTTALWAALIMAMAVPQIEYAQEVRGYAMLSMFYLAAANATVRIERLGATLPRAAWLTLWLLGAMLTHYYGVGAVLAVGMYALIRLRAGQQSPLPEAPHASATAARQAMFAAIGAVVAAIAIFALVCGPLLVAQRANFHNNMTWIADDRDGLIWRTIYRVSVLPLRFLIIPMSKSMNLAPLSVALLVVPLLMLRRRPDLLLWCLLAWVAVALVAAADLINGSQSLNKIRYTLAAAGPVYALAAALLSDRSGWLRHTVPGVLSLSCLAGLPSAYIQWKQDWRGFAQDLARQTGPEDVFVFYQTDENDWYQPLLHAGITHYEDLWRRPLLRITAAPSPQLWQELRAAPGVWIFAGGARPPINRFLPGAIPCGKIDAPGVGQAIRLKLPPPATSSAK